MVGQIDLERISDAYLLFDAPDRVCGKILFGGQIMAFEQEKIDPETKTNIRSC